MLNHSCRPNTLARFDGNEMEVVATRPIGQGEPLTISYGPLASKIPSVVQRRTTLQNSYFFHCLCPACIDADRESSHASASSKEVDLAYTTTSLACRSKGCQGELCVSKHKYLSKGCRMWCAQCGVNLNPSIAEALLTEVAEDAKSWQKALKETDLVEKANSYNPSKEEGIEGNHVELARKRALDLSTQCLMWRQSKLIGTAMGLARAHDLIARLLAGTGDFAEAASHCEEAVRILEKKYSQGDVELGQEMFKLAGLYFNAGLLSRCFGACQQAKGSLTVCLQADDPQLQELQDMEHCCRQQLSL
ncbi:unnamed protein product [Choristocarpus tenellus]